MKTLRMFGSIAVASMLAFGLAACGDDNPSGSKDVDSSSSPSIKVEKGTVEDSRDGKVYKTVKIGAQTWMAENLNYQIVTSKCYDDKPENCEKYGRLYTWGDAKKACPAGWRLPSVAEFESLLVAVGTSGEERSQNLRAGSWENGSDTFGFSALPDGDCSCSDEEFDVLRCSSYFWSSTEFDRDYAYLLLIQDRFAYGGSDAYVDYYRKYYGYSVRCLQNSN